jgi:hypothetical protein
MINAPYWLWKSLNSYNTHKNNLSMHKRVTKDKRAWKNIPPKMASQRRETF